MMVPLATRMVTKPWGRDHLPAPFVAPLGEKVGEIWFEPSPADPRLLVKYLFTSDKLSVQVHPTDAQTEALGMGAQGKEECWLVLDAEPGAMLGIGFAEDVPAERLRAAALDGSIEAMLAWRPVVAGDFFYIPATTVHAIGAGVSLVEVQLNSDITYRLYDYGRPRALHLDEAIAVARAGRYDEAMHRRLRQGTAAMLVEGPFFRLYHFAGLIEEEVRARFGHAPVQLLPLHGAASIDGATVQPGESAIALSIDTITIADEATGLIAQPLGPSRA